MTQVWSGVHGSGLVCMTQVWSGVYGGLYDSGLTVGCDCFVLVCYLFWREVAGVFWSLLWSVRCGRC